MDETTIPAWVELAELGEMLGRWLGRAATPDGLAELWRAIEGGRVLLRWSPDLLAWRAAAKEAGEPLYLHLDNFPAADPAALASQVALGKLQIDRERGLLNALGGGKIIKHFSESLPPRVLRREVLPAVWQPVGPAQVRWSDVEDLGARRGWRQRKQKAATPKNTPTKPTRIETARQFY